MSTPILTVVIPTYDRPQQLKNLLDTLLPQTNDRWKLLVVDNCSPKLVRDYVSAEVEVQRNPANIGVAGNLPHCFVQMDTDWVWMIGDDDLVDSDGIERVLAAIAEHPDAAILNFGSHDLVQKRSDVTIFRGFDEFVTKSASLVDSIWVSANVYSRKHYWPFMGLAYRFANSQSSHYVLLMMVLIAGGTYVQLPNPVCRQADNFAESASHGELVYSLGALADLPLTTVQRRIFLSRLQRGYAELLRDIVQTVFHLDNREARDEILYLFRVRWALSSIGRRSLGLLAVATVARLLFSNGIGRYLIKSGVRLKEKVTGRPTYLRRYRPRFFRAT